MAVRKHTKAAARRAASAYAAQARDGMGTLRPDYVDYLSKWRPTEPFRDHDTGVAAVAAVMSRAGHLAPANFRKHCSDVSALVRWAQDAGVDTSWQNLMSHDTIHAFSATPEPSQSERHRADRMRRLKALATHLNPGPAAPPRPVPISHRAVQAPYTQAEMAAIVRIARMQPGSLKRELAGIIGVCRGAGAGVTELRALTGGHFTDLGDEGIQVTLGHGLSERTIPVRRAWEELMREGLDGVRSGQLLFGTKVDRRNVAASVFARMQVLGTDLPPLHASRLRSTWLADLMTDAIPVQVIMHAAGLQSARSLTDIATWLQRQNPDTPASVLRGGSR